MDTGVRQTIRWLTAAREGFGPHRILVGQQLVRAATESAMEWKASELAATTLAQAVANLSGAGTAEMRVDELATDLRHHAEQMDPAMLTHVVSAIARTLDARCNANVPVALQPRVRELAEAALLWPAVFGGHCNPLAAVVDLLRMDVFPSVESNDLLLYHHQLARPVAVPPPQAKPAVLQIVRGNLAM